MGDRVGLWRVNQQGRMYKPGTSDEGLWHNIVHLHNQGKENKEISFDLKCSPGLVCKVLAQLQTSPNPTPHHNGGNGTRPHVLKNYSFILSDYLNGGIKVKDLGGHLEQEIGPSFGRSTVYRVVKKDLGKTLQKAKKVDPRKFEEQNVTYYLDYLYFQRSLSIDEALCVKSFDECGVAVTDLGNVKVWAERGQRPSVEQWKQSPNVERFSVIILTCLDGLNSPLVYRIIEGACNGDEFVQFFAAIALPHVYEKDTVVGDNLNYHWRGPAAETVRTMIYGKKARYKMQPKHSPEFNPSEPVFSYLKQQLRVHYTIYNDLRLAITEILNSITLSMMMGWYKHCGWL